jgi:hypothetical protein
MDPINLSKIEEYFGVNQKASKNSHLGNFTKKTADLVYSIVKGLFSLITLKPLRNLFSLRNKKVAIHHEKKTLPLQDKKTTKVAQLNITEKKPDVTEDKPYKTIQSLAGLRSEIKSTPEKETAVQPSSPTFRFSLESVTSLKSKQFSFPEKLVLDDESDSDDDELFFDSYSQRRAPIYTATEEQQPLIQDSQQVKQENQLSPGQQLKADFFDTLVTSVGPAAAAKFMTYVNAGTTISLEKLSQPEGLQFTTSLIQSMGPDLTASFMAFLNSSNNVNFAIRDNGKFSLIFDKPVHKVLAGIPSDSKFDKLNGKPIIIKQILEGTITPDTVTFDKGHLNTEIEIKKWGIGTTLTASINSFSKQKNDKIGVQIGILPTISLKSTMVSDLFKVLSEQKLWE